MQRVTARIMEGYGDLLPVSASPVDGTFPTDTAKWEKRSIAHEVPIWEPDVCTQCNLCALACPHAAIRVNAVTESALEGALEGFKSVAWKGRDEALQGASSSSSSPPTTAPAAASVWTSARPATSASSSARRST